VVGLFKVGQGYIRALILYDRSSDNRIIPEDQVDSSTSVPPLVQYLAQLSEYRQARGQQYPLLALLLLVCIAMLCGARSQSAIADWGAGFGRCWLRRLGFTRDHGPS